MGSRTTFRGVKELDVARASSRDETGVASSALCPATSAPTPTESADGGSTEVAPTSSAVAAGCIGDNKDSLERADKSRASSNSIDVVLKVEAASAAAVVVLSST
jgi:hypothetical protein